eukprot:746831-Hanusia_phi.AAC.2
MDSCCLLLPRLLLLTLLTRLPLCSTNSASSTAPLLQSTVYFLIILSPSTPSFTDRYLPPPPPPPSIFPLPDSRWYPSAFFTVPANWVPSVYYPPWSTTHPDLKGTPPLAGRICTRKYLEVPVFQFSVPYLDIMHPRPEITLPLYDLIMHSTPTHSLVSLLQVPPQLTMDEGVIG